MKNEWEEREEQGSTSTRVHALLDPEIESRGTEPPDFSAESKCL